MLMPAAPLFFLPAWSGWACDDEDESRNWSSWADSASSTVSICTKDPNISSRAWASLVWCFCSRDAPKVLASTLLALRSRSTAAFLSAVSFWNSAFFCCRVSVASFTAASSSLISLVSILISSLMVLTFSWACSARWAMSFWSDFLEASLVSPSLISASQKFFFSSCSACSFFTLSIILYTIFFTASKCPRWVTFMLSISRLSCPRYRGFARAGARTSRARCTSRGLEVSALRWMKDESDILFLSSSRVSSSLRILIASAMPASSSARALDSSS
mmetsp:Transcript_5924/g.14057  ORF Transcript_5924/g.14057 Transcript_5924/m.14057 type:complete len:274 (-) Transcript_5924:972-1793(-)